MLLILQNGLYCLLFFLLVKCAVRDNGMNCLYFYPKAYIAEAQRRGLADQKTIMKQGKHFMIPFCIGMLAVLVVIISFWNRVTDFRTAYLQACLFLIVMNWFDGIVMDRLWVGHSHAWEIAGMEGVPYVKPWRTVLIKRSLGTVLYLIIALAVAGMVVLLGKFESLG